MRKELTKYTLDMAENIIPQFIGVIYITNNNCSKKCNEYKISRDQAFFFQSFCQVQQKTDEKYRQYEIDT